MILIEEDEKLEISLSLSLSLTLHSLPVLSKYQEIEFFFTKKIQFSPSLSLSIYLSLTLLRSTGKEKIFFKLNLNLER